MLVAASQEFFVVVTLFAVALISGAAIHEISKVYTKVAALKRGFGLNSEEQSDNTGEWPTLIIG